METQAPSPTAAKTSAATPTARQGVTPPPHPFRSATPSATTAGVAIATSPTPTASSPNSTPTKTITPMKTSAPAKTATAPVQTSVAQSTPTSVPTRVVSTALATVVPTVKPSPAATSHSGVSPSASSALAARYRTYQVGAYYFSGWSHGLNNNVTPQLTGQYPDLEPLIGWYDDSQQAVDKTIDQAANAGVNFFAFDWYDISMSTSPTDRTLNEALNFYTTSSQRKRLHFCLMYVDQPPFVPATGELSAQHWSHLITLWLSYMKQPDYVRVSGKPLFIIFSPEHLDTIFGGVTGVRAALNELRSRARADGLPGVSIAVAATVVAKSNPARVAILNAEGYDLATGYNYHSLGDEQYGVPAPYSNLVTENVDTWNQVSSRVSVPYIPVVTSGFDLRYSSRSNEKSTAIIYGGRTAAKFACFAVQARHWIDTHPNQTTQERIVMIYAWNELAEGGAIIPTKQDGYGYANAVREVFGTTSQAPATPSCP